jgi:hypothetical protein
MIKAPSSRFRTSIGERTNHDKGGSAVSNEEEQGQKPNRSYANRGIYLPGLRPVRQRLGLTQRGLAARAGTGQHTICKLETLQRGAYPLTLQKLAMALGVSPADLVEGRVEQ